MLLPVLSTPQLAGIGLIFFLVPIVPMLIALMVVCFGVFRILLEKFFKEKDSKKIKYVIILLFVFLIAISFFQEGMHAFLSSYNLVDPSSSIYMMYLILLPTMGISVFLSKLLKVGNFPGWLNTGFVSFGFYFIFNFVSQIIIYFIGPWMPIMLYGAVYGWTSIFIGTLIFSIIFAAILTALEATVGKVISVALNK